MKIVAIDYGLKRIGVAISDAKQILAFPLATVAGGAKAIADLKTLLEGKRAEIERIIIGLPLLLNGKEGDMAILVKKFAASLQESIEIPVEFVDERFTSKLADQRLQENYLNRKERTAKLDTAAAVILLQGYLDRKP